MFPVRLLLLPLLALLAAPLLAQRPKSATEALSRYEKVKDGTEAERRRPVGDLGAFEGAEITAALLAELERAEELGYRQTVVRALGEKAREGIVPALRKALREATNNRLMDSACEGLARQGEPGVVALGEVLAQAEPKGSLRSSVCDGLGRAGSESARDLLLRECNTAGGRDRLPALRGLANWQGDAKVDELRVQFAGDKDSLVAATALLQLAEHEHDKAPELAAQFVRRLQPNSSAEHYTAALRGLLLAPLASKPKDVILAATLAEDPFGPKTAPWWTKALGNPAFVQWLVQQTPQLSNLERATAAQALGLVAATSATAVAPVLGKLLGDKDALVVRAAAESLANLGAELAVPPLQKLLATGSEAQVPIALHALHRLRREDPAWAAELLQQTSAKSATARAAALQLLASLPQVDAERAVAAAVANLPHKAWPVRGAAIDLLVAVRAPAGIPALIERLDAETARLQLDVQNALYELTRLRLGDTAAWRSWWQKEGASFVVPKSTKDAEPKKGRNAPRSKQDPGTVATYWAIPVRSDRVVFVVDISGSMNQPFGTGGGTRLDEAKRQLVRVLGMLPKKAKANVVAFGNGAQVLADTLQTIDDKRRKAAEEWTKALECRGATNVYAAMQRAFADPEVDTIFLLTDGQPSTGEITAPGPLADAIAAWNLGRGVRIHTVAIGGKSDFLERLARESGGEHSSTK
jgi:Mg-chelatase subunit ChlD